MCQTNGEITAILCLTIPKTQYCVQSMVFMMKMTKFWKMPLLLLLMSQKYGGNSGNFPNCNHIVCIAIPNEGNR